MKSVLFFFQLEEANRTLTSDVANLANEKEELNNKMKEALEGKELLFSNDCYDSLIIKALTSHSFMSHSSMTLPLECLRFSTDVEKSKDWEQQISQMTLTFEKQLQSERTLKTQVSTS